MRALLVLFGPVLVIGLVWSQLTRPPGLGPQALAFDEAARRRPWDVVVAGASFAASDIDARAMDALVLAVPASSAPTWYAVLKERVYGNGLTPELVVLPVSVPTLMVTRLAPGQAAKLTDHMPVLDEVVARRTLGYAWLPRLRQVLERRGELREPVLDAFRNTPPRWLLQADPDRVSAAATSVFGEHHDEAGARVLPAVETGMPARDAAAAVATDPAESYLADITALVQAHGGTLVVVLPPVSHERSRGHALDPAVERNIERWARTHGVRWLDFRDLGWDTSRFRDGRHLTTASAREFTALVQGKLASADDGLLAPLPTSVVRTGTPPALPQGGFRPGKSACEGNIPLAAYGFLGRKATEVEFPTLASPIRVLEAGAALSPGLRRGSCTGSYVHRADVAVSSRSGGPLTLGWADELPTAEGTWWVYPGTALTWTFEEPAPGELHLRAGLLGPGTGVAEVLAGDARAPLVRDGTLAEARLPGPGTPWTLTIRSPADGPFLFVHSLEVEAGGERAAVVAPPAPRALPLFAPGTWQVATTPPELPPLERKGAAFVAPWRSRTDCTPLKVVQGGVEVPSRHRGDRLTFEAAGEVRVILSADRQCPRACRTCPDQVWLYPGETLVTEVPAGSRATHKGTVERLRLGTTVEAPAGAGVSVRVSLGDETLADRVLSAEELGRLASIELSRSVAATEPGGVTVEVTASPDLPPVLLVGDLEGR